MFQVLNPARSLAIIVHPDYYKVAQESKEPHIPRGWRDLPQNVILKIASNLGAKELSTLSSVSTECQHLANDDQLWKHLCHTKFKVPLDATPPSWKDLYRFNHVMFRRLFTDKENSQVNNLPFGGNQLSAGPILIQGVFQ